MIDWHKVKELRDEVGAEDFDEIVEVFLEEVEGHIADLLQKPDRSALAEDLHFLKGSALNLGFRDLAALCKTGEAASEAGQADTVDLNEVSTVYEASKAAFFADLTQLNAA
ncbi:MAG: Hpt domain-containing protein [Pseudomonadota bacterium]